MKKFYKIFSLAALFLCSGSMLSHADNIKVYANDFTVGAGQVTTVKIYLQNAPACSAIDLAFDMPEGIFIKGYEEEGDIDKADYSINEIKPTGGDYTLYYNPEWAGDGAFTFQAYTSNDDLWGDGPKSAEGTWIISFDVISKATETITGTLKFNEEYTTINNIYAGEEGFEAPESEAIASDKFIVKLPSSGVATICSTEDLDVSGLKAYYVSSIVDKKVKGTAIEGALKAGEGAVIQGEGGAVVEIPLATEAAVAPELNLLVGVTKFTKFSDVTGIYFMSGGKFKKAASNGTLAAGKAYLDSNKAGAKGFEELEFVVEEDVTAIKAVETEQNAGVLYNLNGIRVDNPTKGVYIQNGRKVVVK